MSSESDSQRRTDLGALANSMQTSVLKVCPEVTPMRALMEMHGMSNHLADAGDAEIEAFEGFGETLLSVAFGYVLVQLTIKESVLSKETRGTIIARSDCGDPGSVLQASIKLEVLSIFFGCLCQLGGVDAGVSWFQKVLGEAILAADDVFTTYHAASAVTRPVSPAPPVVTRYKRALAFLLSSSRSAPMFPEPGISLDSEASSSIPSADSQSQTSTCDPASHYVPASDVMVGGEVEVGEAVVSSTQTVDEEPRGLTKLLGAVFSNVVEHEGKQLYGIAKTDGVLAMAVAVPRVFASGAISAILNRKRNAEVDEDELGARPTRRRKPNPEAPPPATDPSVSVPPAVPLPTTITSPSDTPGPSSAPVRVEGSAVPIAKWKAATPSGPSVAKAVRRIDSLTELQPAAAATPPPPPPPPAVPGTDAP